MADKIFYHDVSSRYFLKAGPKNTKAVLEAAAIRAKDLTVKKVLIATCSGRTAFEAVDILGEGIKIIAVTHVTGFLKPDVQELSDDARRQLETHHVTILTSQHAFGGVGRALRTSDFSSQPRRPVATP